MEYQNLGRTGVKVSPLCLGTMNFGSRTSEDKAFCIIDRAVEVGLNLIDTANLYGDANEGVGRAEEIIGKALSRNGKRDQIVLATKVFFQMDPGDPNSSGLSRRHIVAECEASLRRLRTDYIDLYQLHRPSPDVPIDETIRALDDLIRAGKVRYIGACEFSAWQTIEALWTSDRLRMNRFVTEQSFYNMTHRSIERELVPMALQHGIALLPYSPLGGGILTGQYRRGQPYPDGSRLTFEKWAAYWDDLNDRVYDLLDLLAEISAEKSCTISQLALAWTMAQPGITSVILGPRTQEQLDDNLGALDVIVTAKDMERIDAISKPKGTLLNG
ncbi:MAG: aldo/keto reductase [Anaerolineae bacterium]|nr:aldo/keto reductase [Anaerolineae bacterium]